MQAATAPYPISEIRYPVKSIVPEAKGGYQKWLSIICVIMRVKDQDDEQIRTDCCYG